MDAYAAIYRRFGTACFNLALRILGERAAAEDVVQEVFLKMINTLSSFRGDAPFGVWLKRMTANATIVARLHSSRASRNGSQLRGANAIAACGG